MLDSDKIKALKFDENEKLLSFEGEYRGINILLKIDDIEENILSYKYLSNAKSMLIEVETHDDFDFDKISDVVFKLNSYALIFMDKKENKALKEDEIILKILAAGI